MRIRSHNAVPNLQRRHRAPVQVRKFKMFYRPPLPEGTD